MGQHAPAVLGEHGTGGREPREDRGDGDQAQLVGHDLSAREPDEPAGARRCRVAVRSTSVRVVRARHRPLVRTDYPEVASTQNTPDVVVERGDTTAMFQHPKDQRTSDYVNGRFG